MKLTKGKISKAIRKKKQSMKKYKRKNVKKSGAGKVKTFRKRKGTNLLKSTLKNYGLIGGTPGDLFTTPDGDSIGNYKELKLTPDSIKGNTQYKFIEAYDGKKADITSDAAIDYMQKNKFVDPNITSEIEMKDMSKKSESEPEPGVVPGPESENQEMNFVDPSVVPENDKELNDVSLEDDNSVLQEEIANLKQQISQLQKQVKSGSGSGSDSDSKLSKVASLLKQESGSDTSSIKLSDGQQNALAGMQGFEPSNMVAFLKTFMILIATIIKLNNSNAGGDGDLKQAMSILASGLKPEGKTLGGVVDAMEKTALDTSKVGSESGPESGAENESEGILAETTTNLQKQLDQLMSDPSEEAKQKLLADASDAADVFASETTKLLDSLTQSQGNEIVEELKGELNETFSILKDKQTDPSIIDSEINKLKEMEENIEGDTELKQKLGQEVIEKIEDSLLLGLAVLEALQASSKSEEDEFSNDAQSEVVPSSGEGDAGIGGKKKRKSKTQKTHKKCPKSKRNNSKKNKSK